MLNTLKLKAAQIESGVTVNQIASIIGLNPVTVYRKMSGESEFTLSELYKMKNVLKLDRDDFCNIFFAPELTEMQENSTKIDK